MKGEAFFTLEEALHFVDREIRHKAGQYAYSQPDAVPDLLQLAKIAIWHKWQQCPDHLDHALAYKVAIRAAYTGCICGCSVDSHILRTPSRRPTGYFDILSMDADDKGNPRDRPSAEGSIDLFASQKRSNVHGQPSRLRLVEEAATTNVMLDQLEGALPNEKLRITLRLLRQGYTKAQVARMEKWRRNDVTDYFRRIAAAAHDMWIDTATYDSCS